MSYRRSHAPDLACNVTWSATLGAPDKKESKRVILPIQLGWAAPPIIPPPESHNVDVRLYVRGGPWVEQFSSKLVGEMGGNRQLSSIYLSGALREKGESEFRAKLEARGLTLPSWFQCEEWLLFQRQGHLIILKLEYSKPLLLEEMVIFLEASLSDPDVWWSLPVLVDTKGESVYGRSVTPGVYAPATEGRDIVVAVANRGPENVAVMPYIDGHCLLKSPYFLWSVESLKKDPDHMGCTFITFPGVQTGMQPKKKDRVEVTFRGLKFGRTRADDLSDVLLSPEQGSLRVAVFKPKKVVFRSDPNRALEQADTLRNSVFLSQASTKCLEPLALRPKSSEMAEFELCVEGSGEEVRQLLSSTDMVYEAQYRLAEIIIHYRPMEWFKEAAAAKNRAFSSLSDLHSAVAAMDSHQSLPSPTKSLMSPSKRTGKHSGATPDSIAPRGLTIVTKPSEIEPDLGPDQDGDGSSFNELQKSLEMKLSLLASPSEPAVHSRSRSRSNEAEGIVLSPATQEASQKNRQLSKSGQLPTRIDRLSQPRLPRTDKEPVEPFANSLRSSVTRDRTQGGTSLRDKSPSPGMGSRLARDTSPSPATGYRLRDTSPMLGNAPSSQDRSRSVAPVSRYTERAPVAPGGSGGKGQNPHGVRVSVTPARVRDTSPSMRSTMRSRDGGAPLPSPKEKKLGSGAKSATLGPPTNRKLAFDDKNPRQSYKAGAVVWVIPRIQGHNQTYQKDEIVLAHEVRNVANLRRQVKQELSPLFDEWSTAELVVFSEDSMLGPEVQLSELGGNIGSAGNPFIVEAPAKS